MDTFDERIQCGLARIPLRYRCHSDTVLYRNVTPHTVTSGAEQGRADRRQAPRSRDPASARLVQTRTGKLSARFWTLAHAAAAPPACCAQNQTPAEHVHSI